MTPVFLHSFRSSPQDRMMYPDRGTLPQKRLPAQEPYASGAPQSGVPVIIDTLKASSRQIMQRASIAHTYFFFSLIVSSL